MNDFKRIRFAFFQLSRDSRGFGLVEVLIAMSLMSALAMGTASILTTQSKLSSQSQTYTDTNVLVMELSHALNDSRSLLESAAATAAVGGDQNFLNCTVMTPSPNLQPYPVPPPSGQCNPGSSTALILTDQQGNILANGNSPQFYDNNLARCVPTSPGGTPQCGIEATASYTAYCPSAAPCQPAVSVTISYNIQVATGVTLANHAIFPAATGSMAESIPFQNSSSNIAGGGTTNYIPVWTSSNTLGNTSTMYQFATTDPASGAPTNFYGINTTTPGSQLEVNGGLRAAAGWPADGNNSNIGYSFNANGDTGFFENNGTPTNQGAGDLELIVNSMSGFQLTNAGQLTLGYAKNMGSIGGAAPPSQPTVLVESDPTKGDQATNNLYYQLPAGGSATMPFVGDFAVQRINNNGGQNPGVDMILDATQSATNGHSWGIAVGPNGSTGDVFAIQDFGTVATSAINPNSFTNRLTIDGSGNANFTGALTVNNVPVTTTPSDRRLKTNIQPLEDSLDKIDQLQGVTWDWKDPQTFKGTPMGFVAQDMEQVFPQVVATRSDGYKAIDYPALVAPLAEAVKELDAKNTALAAENAQLKQQLTSTSQRLDQLEAMVQQLMQTQAASTQGK